MKIERPRDRLGATKILGRNSCRRSARTLVTSSPTITNHTAIMTLDGVGEWATTTLGWGRSNGIALTPEIRFPHSLGLLYSAFTCYLGFCVNSGNTKRWVWRPMGSRAFKSLIISISSMSRLTILSVWTRATSIAPA
jgi:predicted NodU family carbamoyl transferase